MVDVQIQRVKDLYAGLQTAAIEWLQSYTGKPFENLELLLMDRTIREIDRTNLNNLFQSFELVAPQVKIMLYSTQSDVNEKQTFYVEVKQKSSGFSFNTQLPSLLAPGHESTGTGLYFFEYLFIQIAALQLADEEKYEITSVYLDEILNYFYENIDKQQSVKEELSMDMFRLKALREEDSEEKEVEVQYTDFGVEAPNTEDDFDFDFDEAEDLDEEFFVDEEEEEVSEDDFDEDESLPVEESLVIDFDSLNQNLNEIYKSASPDNRDHIKSVKGDVWELEMSVEDKGVTAEDIQSLAHTILAMDGTDAVVMKWQIGTAKQLLGLIVNR